MSKKKHDTRKPITIWGWHRKTNLLTGETTALPNPFQHDKWLMPARSTTLEPPKGKKGYSAKWNGEKWVAVKTPK